MKLFSRFTARRITPAKPRITLSLTQLEARDVPAAALDLTHVGASGSINGAIFSQYNDHSAANKNNGDVQSFLRLDDNGRENGYNTDARPLQFDSSRNFTSSIKVSDLPLVSIGGVSYRELVLDVNEPNWQPLISLDALQIFVSNNPKLSGYNSRNDTLGGVAAVYDMDAKGDRWVKIDASLNHHTGTGDMIVDIPASILPTKVGKNDAYLALYSQFGVHNGAGGQYEEWGPGFTHAATTPPPVSLPPVVPPTPTTQDTTLTGTAVYLYSDGSTQPIGPADGIIFLVNADGSRATDADGNYLPEATWNADGTFTFTETVTGTETFNIGTSAGSGMVTVSATAGVNQTGIVLDVAPPGG